MDTRFAPAERLEADAVRKLASELDGRLPLDWLNAVPMGILLLDRHRQIVLCNGAFHALALRARLEDVQGMRMGEALNCVHAYQEPGGCGCSDHCRHCGAAQAILKSLEGEEDCKECRMLRLIQGERAPLDLQVMTRPVRMGEHELSLVTVIDISHEKRLRYLENTFFHDMVNLAGGLSTLTGLMEGDPQDPTLFPLFAETSRRVLREVIYHRDLAAAEDNQLLLLHEDVELRPFLDQAIHEVCLGLGGCGNTCPRLELDCESVCTDKRTLRHIVRNMLKNAVEACFSDPGQVLLRVEKDKALLRFTVVNPGKMPPEIERQLFKRYVSTKGPDRGLGAYVMRLFARQLGGEVSLETGPNEIRLVLTLPQPE